MSSLIIDSKNAGIWFSSIYAFVIIMANVMFILQGVKQKRSFTTIWLIATTGTVLMFAGVHMFPLTWGELKEFILTGRTANIGAKSVLGSLLGFLGIIIVIYWLKEKLSLVDNLVIPFMIGVGFQNIGCFIAGCCYGKSTNFPIHIRYGDHAVAYFDGIKTGAIESHIHSTVALHPTQIYMLLGCLIIATILHRYRTLLKAPLSSFFAAWALYSIFRFFIEFIRDPASNHGLGSMIYTIKVIQWFLLGTGIVFTLFLLTSFFFYKPKNHQQEREVGIWKHVVLTIALLLISWKIRFLVEPISNLIILIFLSISIIIVSWKLLKIHTIPQFRFATISLVFISLIIMGQKYIPNNESDKVTFNQVGVGMQFSRFFNEVGTSTQGTDCNGNTFYYKEYAKKQKHNTVLVGVQYSHVTSYNMYERSTYGIDGLYGYTSGEMTNNTIIGIRPNISYSSRWFGLSLGMNLGQFHMAGNDIDAKADNLGEKVGQLKILNIIPSGSVFFGPYDIGYVKYSYADKSPSSFPVSLYTLMIGSGLGKTDGRFVEFGSAYGGLEVAMSFPINTDMYFSSSLRFKTSTDSLLNRSNFTFGLKYRLHYKSLPKVSNYQEIKKDPVSF